ncbi:MAG: DUF3293 domain-containing protein [Spirochaetes bacterium]|nr:DUF3293 domain-containing protein [Spirochaetota bacterium]
MKEFKDYIEKAQNESNEEQPYLESGRARMLQVLNGVAPKIFTLGIITAENPMGMALSKEENENRNEELYSMLRSGFFGVKQHKGMYGNLENPFMIYNITFGILIKYAKEYHQEQFIFGEKHYNKENLPYMKFSLYEQGHHMANGKKIGDNKFKVISERYFYRDEKNAKDYYSEYKGKKFVIPFYDSDNGFIHAKRIHGKFGRLSYAEDELDNEFQKYCAEEINYLIEDSLRTVGYTSYSKRGQIKNKLDAFLKLLDER